MSLFKRLPSYDFVLQNAGSVLKRFPFSVLSALSATAIEVYLVGLKDAATSEFVLLKLAMLSALGLPLFIALAIYAERVPRLNNRSIAFQALGVVLLGIYYLTLPEDVTGQLMHLVRFGILIIGLHFMVAVLPYLTGDKTPEFWQYNKSLFVHFIISALCSAVMFAGLAIALAAVDYLFGVEVDEIRYLQLLLIMAGAFNTVIFLAGIPKNLDDRIAVGDYPRVLKIFTQYILLPLVVVYFVILISYEAKIITTWNWPKGLVSQLVLWYSVVGILSILLLYPLRDDVNNRWIGRFGRWYFLTSIPLVIMLLLAILRRISDYGFTENRYYVLGMAVALSIGVIYFIFSKKKDIRIIPLILGCLAVISAYGPWSAFSVSMNSQKVRLEKILIDHKILVNASIEKVEGGFSEEERADLSSIVSYLVTFHGVGSFADWLPDSTLLAIDTSESVSKVAALSEKLGFQYTDSRRSGYKYFNLTTEDAKAIPIAGYDYFVPVTLSENDIDSDKFPVGEYSYIVHLDTTKAAIYIRRADADSASVSGFEINLADTIGKITESILINNACPADQMTFDFSGSELQCRMVISSIRGEKDGNKISIEYAALRLFIRKL